MTHLKQYKTLSIDSCVFMKLFLDEGNGERAKTIRLFSYINKGNITLIMPSLFNYEVLNISKRKEIDEKPIFSFIVKLKQKCLSFQELEGEEYISKTLEISNTIHKIIKTLLQYMILAIIHWQY